MTSGSSGEHVFQVRKSTSLGRKEGLGKSGRRSLMKEQKTDQVRKEFGHIMPRLARVLRKVMLVPPMAGSEIRAKKAMMAINLKNIWIFAFLID